jgi:hypothetical protein
LMVVEVGRVMLTGVCTKAAGGLMVGRTQEAGSIDWLTALGIIVNKRFRQASV